MPSTAQKKRSLFGHNGVLIATLAFLVIFSFGSYAFASFFPGQTNDPTCSPGDAGCYVASIPDQTGNSGKYLTTDGTDALWSGNLALTGTATGTVTFLATATTTNYSLTFPATQGATSTFLENDGSGNLSWVTGGGGGANTALSNLSSEVAINADLVPGSNATLNLGSSTTNTWKSLQLAAGTGTPTDGEINWPDTIHGTPIFIKTQILGTQELDFGMGGFTDAILEDNGTTPFFIAGRISSALRGNIGGSTLELSGLEGVSDGTGEPTLALIGSPATAGTTRPQHYWQQFTAVTTDNTPDDITAGTDAPIAANSAVKLHWSVAAIRTGGTAGSPDDTASWDMTCTYKNLSGTATLVGACQKTSAKDNPSLDITPTVAGNLVQLMATGDTNNIYSWHVTWDTEFVN